MCDIGHFVLAYNHCCKWQDWNWLMGRGWERKTTHIHHKHTHKTYTHHRTQIQQAEVNTELVQVECVHKTPSLPLSCFLFPSLPSFLPSVFPPFLCVLPFLFHQQDQVTVETPHTHPASSNKGVDRARMQVMWPSEVGNASTSIWPTWKFYFQVIPNL